MSRTIRRKGWHVVHSSKWNDQNNNIFFGIRGFYNNTTLDRLVERNKNMPDEAVKLQKEVHRDSFWKTFRWGKYSMPVSRNMHKMEITSSLRNDTDYNWDEVAARKYNKGLASLMWD